MNTLENTRRVALVLLTGVAAVTAFLAWDVAVQSEGRLGSVPTYVLVLVGLVAIAAAGVSFAIVWISREHRPVVRLAIFLVVAGFLLTLVSEAAAFTNQVANAPSWMPLLASVMIIAAGPFFIVGLLVLCWPRTRERGQLRRALVDAAVGVLGLGILWVSIVLPGVSRETPEWSAVHGAAALVQFAVVTVVLVMATLSQRRSRLPIIQLILLQFGVGMLAGGEMISAAWLVADPDMVAAASVAVFGMVGVVFVGFLIRPAAEREQARQLWWRDVWATVVPLSPVAVATGTLLFRLATGEATSAGSAAAVAVALLLLVVAIIWQRMLAAFSARRASVQSAVAHFDTAKKQAWFQVLTSHSREMVLVIDAATRVVYASTPLVRLLGLETQDLRGRMLATVLPGVDEDQLVRALGEAPDERPFPVDVTVADTTGQDHDLQFVVSSLKGVGTDGFVLTGTDVSDARRMRAILGETRRRDRLTGLLNRGAFLAAVSDSMNLHEPQRLVVQVVDLLDYRTVNDTHGHAAGDAILTDFAEILDRLGAPVLAASRLDGGEFAILLGGTEPHVAAEAMTDSIHAALSSVRLPDGSSTAVRAAVGYAAPLSGDHPAARLVECADLAATWAAADPKLGLVRYQPHMREELLAQHRLTDELRVSVAHGDFVPFFQPIVLLGSGWVWGMEALARRRQPDGTWQSPDVFIPLAERVGLVGEMDRVIRQTAMEQVGLLSRRWPGLHV